LKVKKVKVEWGGESCNLGMSLEEISIEKRKKRQKEEKRIEREEGGGGGGRGITEEE